MVDIKHKEEKIMSKSELVAVRLPLELLEQIESYGLEHYPKGETYDKSKTIIELIEKALGQKQVQESLNDEFRQRLEIIEQALNLNQVTVETVKKTVDKVKEEKPVKKAQKQPQIKKFYPNQKIFKPYHIEQFKAVYELLTGFGITFLSTKKTDAIQQWVIKDEYGNKAGLFLNSASHWSLGKVNFGDGDLKGFFEDCNCNDYYLDELLQNNLIDLDEIAESYQE